MRDEMLRTLDRIVEAKLVTAVREAAERDEPPKGGGHATVLKPLYDELAEAGLTAISGLGGDDDVTFADAMAVVRRCGYHGLPLPLGDGMLSRWLASQSGLPVPSEGLRLGAVRLSHNSARAADGAVFATDGPIRAVTGSAPVLTAGADARGHAKLAVVTVGAADVRRERNIAGDLSDILRISPPQFGQSLIAAVDCPDAAMRLMATGALLRSVEMTGALDRALEHSMIWVSERVQFGKPIARFQAIQHHMAVLASEVAAAGAAADQAVEASSDGLDVLAIAIAKSRVGEAAGKVANIAHAVFGAMGFTREHQLHYSTRRLWAWRNEFGSEADWQYEIGRRAAAVGGDGLWELLTCRG